MKTTTDPGAEQVKAPEKLRKIDFKMVSFTLGGKDYGIDIMRVKEIRKAGNFTKVPNTLNYVRGVDNLRGDIIPVIDLRIMFNLPATPSPDELESIIILRVDELIIGVVVDTIEKVVGIASETIQPPHPLFGDINIKYISGVVESENRLYIILDADRIFGVEASAKPEEPLELPEEKTSAPAAPAKVQAQPQPSLDLAFISETLGTFVHFHVTDLNRAYVARRAEAWKRDRKASGQDFQLAGREDAEAFLKDFYSTHTAQLWPLDLTKELMGKLAFEGNLISVWNPGCGTGFESYSLAVGLETFQRGKSYKIWANDADLLNISMAPNLVMGEGLLPDGYKEFTVQSKNGIQFVTELKAKVLFEFHDINHLNPFQDLNLIVARDLLSFLKPQEQERVLGEFLEKLRPKGYLVLGQNESIMSGDWDLVETPRFKIYQKR